MLELSQELSHTPSESMDTWKYIDKNDDDGDEE
jgi:hypothetical protein